LTNCLLFRAAARLALSIVMASLLGCGKAEPRRYELSGKVTWAGKPIPAGMLYFEPDLAAGVNGLQGFAIIDKGQYDTRKGGRGTSGGKVVIRIFAGDGIASGEAQMGRPLFPEYQWHDELAAADATKDIDIPADVKNRAAQ
jgi:hypothetical protein